MMLYRIIDVQQTDLYLVVFSKLNSKVRLNCLCILMYLRHLLPNFKILWTAVQSSYKCIL